MKLKLITTVSCFILSASLYAVDPPKTIAPASTSVQSVIKGPINLNTADVKTLKKSMKGIGQKRAEAIIKYRQAHNGFKSVNELAEVPGVGKKFVNKYQEILQKTFVLK